MVALFRSATFLLMFLVTVNYSHAEGFRYVVDQQDGTFQRPSYRPIKLSTSKPADLEVDTEYRGESQHYGEFHYGTPDSLRVAVVVDRVSAKEFDLYVDSERSRTISSDQLIDGEGRVRTTSITVGESASNEGGSRVYQVSFRRGFGDKTLAVATLGFLKGTTELQGKQRGIRRVDGDGNGLFSDAKDRMWLDFDDNKQWDAFTEQYPLTPILRLDGKRFAIRADQLGDQFALKEIIGTAKIKLNIAALEKGTSVDEVDVMMMGEDGSAIAIRGLAEETEVPVGRYAFSTVRLSLDAADGKPWKFVFSRHDKPKAKQWYELKKGETDILDPIGSMEFKLEYKRRGATVQVDPRLYTQDGLLINTSECGDAKEVVDYRNDSSAALIRLAKGTQTISTTRSGFA